MARSGRRGSGEGSVYQRCDRRAGCPPEAEWAALIKAARADQGLSQRELARRAGMDAGHLAKFETGDAGVSDETKFRIARALGKQPTELFPYPEVS